MLKDKLKECRLGCGFSQQQVAEALNIHRSTYSFYESGKTEPSIENIRLLSKIFDVSLYELLEMDPPRRKEPVLGDKGYDEEFVYLREDSIKRTGDLTGDEKTLVMRFRLMTDKQRRELLELLKSPGGDDGDPSEM